MEMLRFIGILAYPKIFDNIKKKKKNVFMFKLTISSYLNISPVPISEKYRFLKFEMLSFLLIYCVMYLTISISF